MQNCPYCGNRGEFYLKIHSRTYNRCLACDLIYKEGQDSYDKILTHYREDYFDRYYSDQIEGSRNKLFNHILDLIEENRGIGKLLDVGTGCGFFLIAAQKRGWGAKGIEPSVQSVEVAQRQHGLDVFNGTFQEYDGNVQFDAVTFINVLDHSVEPWEEVKRAVNLLKPGGIVYFRFPNGLLHTWIYRLASKFAVADLVRKFLVFHEYCFTPRFIRRLFSDQGFTDIEVYNASLSGGSLIHRLRRLHRFSSGLPRGSAFASFHIVSFAIRSIEIMEKLTDLITGGRLLWGPSLDVIARKE